MAQISIIQKSELKGAVRIDPEYYKPEYLEKDEILESINFKNLEDISKSIINFGAYSLCSQIEYLKKGVPFLQVSNIKENFVAGSFKYINEELSLGVLYKSLVKENQVLISIAGTIGNAVVAQGLPKNTNSNQAIANITLKDEVNPFYVSTFLNSIFGKYQSQRLIISNVQPNLLLTQVKSIKVPILPQSFQLTIEKIVKEAHQKQSQAKDLYAEAESLLLAELDLLDYQPKHQLTFSTSKTDIEQAERFDAEYFQPKYDEIMQHIENYSGGFDTVKNIVNWKKGIEVGTEAYTEDGKDFVRVSDVSINGVEQSNRKISNALFTEIKADFQPKQGEILFTKDGTIGISYLLKENIDGVLSSAFLRLTLRDKYLGFEKECLTLILNSVLCKMQVEKLSGGAIIAHLKSSDFDTFKIPLIKQKIQNQIAEKITLSHQLRTESKALLELAKIKVEQAIENPA